MLGQRLRYLVQVSAPQDDSCLDQPVDSRPVFSGTVSLTVLYGGVAECLVIPSEVPGYRFETGEYPHLELVRGILRNVVAGVVQQDFVYVPDCRIVPRFGELLYGGWHASDQEVFVEHVLHGMTKRLRHGLLADHLAYACGGFLGSAHRPQELLEVHWMHVHEGRITRGREQISLEGDAQQRSGGDYVASSVHLKRLQGGERRLARLYLVYDQQRTVSVFGEREPSRDGKCRENVRCVPRALEH